MAYNALAVVQLEATSGLPEDRAVNTFAFRGATGSLDTANATLIFNAVADFYNTSNGAGDAVSEFIGQTISRTAAIHRISMYDLEDPIDLPMGSPVLALALSINAANAGTTQLPDEVAACVSFHADLTNVPEEIEDPANPGEKDRPAARRRGRVYIGPLHSSASDQGSSSTPPFLATAFRTALKDAAVRLKNTSSGPVWSVWSRADNTLRAVTGGFVDNAFDVQRRRGRKATTRTTW